MIPPKYFDYACKGLELNFSLSIDYAMNVRAFKSYHSRDAGTNPFILILEYFKNLLTIHSVNNRFPTYGLGAVKNERHCQFFNMDGSNDLISDGILGINNVINNYLFMLSSVKPCTERHLSPTLKNIIELTKLNSRPKTYQVLFVFLMGESKDIEETKKYLYETSNHPISIVFFGFNGYLLQDAFSMLSKFSKSNYFY